MRQAEFGNFWIFFIQLLLPEHLVASSRDGQEWRWKWPVGKSTCKSLPNIFHESKEVGIAPQLLENESTPLLRHSLPLLHPGITGGACCPSLEPGELKPNPERFILLFPAKEQGQKLTLSAFALNKSEPLEVVRTHKSKPVKVKRRKIQGMTPN